MKKLLAFALAFVLVFSLSVSAWAASSPSRSDDTSSDDLPAQSEAVAEAVVTPEEEAEVIANEDLTEEQIEAVDEAIEAVTGEGYLPVDTFYVESEGEAVVTIALEDGVVVFIIYPDGTVLKLTLDELTEVSSGRYEIPVDGDCVVVIAKEA